MITFIDSSLSRALVRALELASRWRVASVTYRRSTWHVRLERAQ